MSQEYEGQDPLVIAQQAERDLNSNAMKQGVSSGSTSSTFSTDHPTPDEANAPPADESGVNAAAANKFPGGGVTYGSAASGAGGNREIPPEEGGDINRATGH